MSLHSFKTLQKLPTAYRIKPQILSLASKVLEDLQLPVSAAFSLAQ